MRTIRQKVYGKLLTEKDTASLWLADGAEAVSGITPDMLYLRYALTIRGPESLFFPALALDDYGNEVRKLKLYEWLRANGDYHPRSEVFGFEPNGKETQHFIREIEVYFKYPVFAYPDLETALPHGVQLRNIVVVDAEAGAEPQRIKRPDGLKMPLQRASVQWWQVSAEMLPTVLSDIATWR